MLKKECIYKLDDARLINILLNIMLYIDDYILSTNDNTYQVNTKILHKLFELKNKKLNDIDNEELDDAIRLVEYASNQNIDYFYFTKE
jgi:hypothetical protein